MDDPRYPKVVRHHAICYRLCAECGYKIVVDDSRRTAIPVEIDDN
jgi:hypothetical protein